MLSPVVFGMFISCPICSDGAGVHEESRIRDNYHSFLLVLAIQFVVFIAGKGGTGATHMQWKRELSLLDNVQHDFKADDNSIF